MKALKPGDFSESEVITNKQFVLSHTSSYIVSLQGYALSGSFYDVSFTSSNVADLQKPGISITPLILLIFSFIIN